MANDTYFRSPRAQLDRCTAHMKDFCKGYFDHVNAHAEWQTTQAEEWKLMSVRCVAPVPDPTCACLSDAANNLRRSLDTSLVAAARRHGGGENEDRDRKLQFPIAETDSSLAKSLKSLQSILPGNVFEVLKREAKTEAEDADLHHLKWLSNRGHRDLILPSIAAHGIGIAKRGGVTLVKAPGIETPFTDWLPLLWFLPEDLEINVDLRHVPLLKDAPASARRNAILQMAANHTRATAICNAFDQIP
ncbi:hypothetical protein AB7M63_003615 [Bradyrhizobium japonicum]